MGFNKDSNNGDDRIEEENSTFTYQPVRVIEIEEEDPSAITYDGNSLLSS
jgi:hypothetical protein